MNYIDGLIAAVPTKNKDAYTRHVKQVVRFFKKLEERRPTSQSK